MAYPVDLQSLGWLPIGDSNGGPAPCNILINSYGTRIVFAWEYVYPLYFHLAALVSPDRGQTWIETDAANAIMQFSRYARICPHPTDANKVCVAYSHVLIPNGNCEIFVRMFDIETLEWGAEIGGLLPEDLRQSATLEGLCSRSVAGDLVLLVRYYEVPQSRFRWAFCPLSLGDVWSTPANCVGIDPAAIYGTQHTGGGIHGIVVDGDDNCHATVVSLFTYMPGPTATYYIHHSMLSGAAVTETELDSMPDTGYLFTASLLWHPLGYLYLFGWNTSTELVKAGYCADGSSPSFNLDPLDGMTPAAFSVESKVYLFIYSAGTYYPLLVVTFDAATGVAEAVQEAASLFPGSTNYNALATFIRALPSGVAQLSAIFGRQYYYETLAGASYLELP